MKPWILSVVFGVTIFGTVIADAGKFHNAEQAFHVWLNEAGVAKMATEISDHAIPERVENHLDDADYEMPQGIKARTEAAWFEMSFGELTLVPSEDGLLGKVEISDTTIHVARIKLRKKILGGTLRSTCYDTTVYIAENEALPVTFTLQSSVRQGRVGLVLAEQAFHIPESNYRVSGPSRCTGDLGIGSIIRTLVRDAIIKARKDLEDAVLDEMTAAVPAMEDQVNSTLNFQTEMAIGAIAPFPAFHVSVETSPFDLAMDEGGLKLTLSAEFTSELVAREAESQDGPIGLPPGQQNLATLGHIGFHPVIVAELLQALFPEGTPEIELREEEIPNIQEILRVNSASSIWPDLLEANLAQDHLRLWVQIPEMPTFAAESSTHLIRVNIPKLALRFQANLNGEWQDYFHMDVDIAAKLRMEMLGGRSQIKFATAPNLRLSGDWAEGYAPATELIEWDVAETLLLTILEYLYYGDPIYQGETPEIPLGSGNIALQGTTVWRDFVLARMTAE